MVHGARWQPAFFAPRGSGGGADEDENDEEEEDDEEEDDEEDDEDDEDEEDEEWTRYSGDDDHSIKMNECADTWAEWEPSNFAENALKNAVDKNSVFGRG